MIIQNELTLINKSIIKFAMKKDTDVLELKEIQLCIDSLIIDKMIQMINNSNKKIDL